jgi:hypothetical protein
MSYRRRLFWPEAEERMTEGVSEELTARKISRRQCIRATDGSGRRPNSNRQLSATW